MIDAYQSLLACPACGSGLSRSQADFSCVCGASYPIKDGRIFFLDSSSEHPSDQAQDSAVVKLKNRLKKFPKAYNFILAVFGASKAGVSAKGFLKKYLKADDVALNLGAGTQDKLPNTIHVDMFAFEGIDLIADIEKLPFKNGSCGGVMCQAVLEHVLSPEKVMREIFRVLKPGGKCYITLPFMYPFHSSPHDYYRWSHEGVKELAKRNGFAETSSGLRYGPTTALFLVLADWLGAVFSFGSSKAYTAVSLLMTVILSPLAHVFDFLLSRYKVSENVASGFYYIGTKVEEV